MLRQAWESSAVRFDEALLVARVPKGQSRAAATEVAKGQDLASKPDLFEFGAQLRTEMDNTVGRD